MSLGNWGGAAVFMGAGNGTQVLYKIIKYF